MGFCNCSMFCCALVYVHSSFAIILVGKRVLVAFLRLSSWCMLIGVWLFLAVSWLCLQFVIVVFPDQTHLKFPPCYFMVTYLTWLLHSKAPIHKELTYIKFCNT